MKKALAGGYVVLALLLGACGVTVVDDASGSDGAASERVGSTEDGSWETDLNLETWDDEESGTEAEGPGSDEGAAEPGDDPPPDVEEEVESGSGVTPGLYAAPEGGVERGYDLQFEVSEDGAVLHSLEANVLETCDGESTSETITIGPELAWDIVDGRFSARYEEEIEGGGAYYTTLEGSFSGTTATGVVRQESAVAGWVCDTYELDFTAELQ